MDFLGVDKDVIDFKCDGEMLIISVVGDCCEYDECICFLVCVDEYFVLVMFNNGVL